MKKFMVREARAALTDLLDAAERGDSVVIERRGVLFTLSAARPEKPRPRRAPRIARVADSVLSGEWTWDWTPDGVAFREP
ncbi:MAG: type II toxin-antitoxin system Phd/YefM family antitoxin [Vicinamibacterales bacterium]